MRALKYQEWELSIIRQLYPNILEIRRRLPHRPVGSIKSKARQLNLASPRAPDWTLPEIKVLTGLYPDIDAICRALPGRTRIAIVERIKVLGLGRRLKRWTTEREEILRKMYDALSDQELGRVLGTSAGAVATKRLSMGLLRHQAPKNKKARLPIVNDIRNEARRRGVFFRAIANAAHCYPLTNTTDYGRLSWVAVARVVDSMGGEFYVEWDD